MYNNHMSKKFYNRHEIKKGWNHKLSPVIRELEISDLDKECLQAICKFGKVFIYKGRNNGLPASLEPQLGYRPKNEEIIQSFKTLESKGYVRCLGIDLEGKKQIVNFSYNEFEIKKDANQDAGNVTLPKGLQQLFDDE